MIRFERPESYLCPLFSSVSAFRLSAYVVKFMWLIEEDDDCSRLYHIFILYCDGITCIDNKSLC